MQNICKILKKLRKKKKNLSKTKKGGFGDFVE